MYDSIDDAYWILAQRLLVSVVNLYLRILLYLCKEVDTICAL